MWLRCNLFPDSLCYLCRVPGWWRCNYRLHRTDCGHSLSSMSSVPCWPLSYWTLGNFVKLSTLRDRHSRDSLNLIFICEMWELNSNNSDNFKILYESNDTALANQKSSFRKSLLADRAHEFKIWMLGLNKGQWSLLRPLRLRGVRVRLVITSSFKQWKPVNYINHSLRAGCFLCQRKKISSS